ncbi:MAG: hypothetical protein Q9170_000612 [Blastenia crenularia]
MEFQGTWAGKANVFAEGEERRVLFAALDSFSQYRKVAHLNVTHRRRQKFYALPSIEWKRLSAPPFNFLATLDQVDDAVDANADIAAQILESGLQSFGLEKNPRDGSLDWHGSATPADLDKARSTIRQLYRDWSAGGAKERESSYGPVLRDIANAFADVPDKENIRVLVPGAGLARLLFELCSRGYNVEGNEVSYHQLIASNWILNQTERVEQYSLFPFAFNFTNVISRADQLSEVKIPDVHPATALAQSVDVSRKSAIGRMKMTAADFCELYSDVAHRNQYDAVATVFFLDTAPNVIRYIQTVYYCLRPGGIWTNNGPLLWHFADQNLAQDDGETAGQAKQKSTDKTDYGQVELSVEEVLLLIENMSFEIINQGIHDRGSGYINNPYSMQQSWYRLSQWMARKIT